MYTVSRLFSVYYVGVLYIFVVWLMCLIIKSLIYRNATRLNGRERKEVKGDRRILFHIMCHVM